MRSHLPSLRLACWPHEQKHHKQCTDPSIIMEESTLLRLRDRRQKMWRGFCGILWIAFIYLVSELLIWGLSRALTKVKLEFIASVLGMLLVFTVMLVLRAITPKVNEWYEKHVKNAVDFINRHMGVAFAIPMVMLTGTYSVDVKTIGVVVGIFLANSLAVWVTVFVIAKFTHIIITKLFDQFRQSTTPGPGAISTEKDTSCSAVCSPRCTSSFSASCNTASSQESNLFSTDFLETSVRQPAIWNWISKFWPLITSFTFLVAVGLPLAAVLKEPRIIDGCALWFIWMACVTLQRDLKKRSKLNHRKPWVFPILATLVNPVMLTILLMTAYVRIKAYSSSMTISDVLYKLSSGTQLYTIWSLGVEQNPAFAFEWFGAGDAALSMLGCGFVVWGFKLYECRHQLFSASGIVAILVSVAAAAGNVFLAAYLGSLMGLESPEALALAARMTTLALAIPVMKNVGGNASLTVVLMITNGILGQLMYPKSLNGTRTDNIHRHRNASTHSFGSAETIVPSATESHGTLDEESDSSNTVAAGIAIGINGAAMGVAYLYEHESRSAPYATLSMTTYGVATVVFIGVHPFKEALLSLV
ncbi:hypothetical protein CCM_08109 [Cordyceps militaris CM01]|uniref:LrgB-like protein n=1 Tax=Cordyceps militaris (strain CM01) TaxID=983644 RepID=G3JNL6_CORMM|nr:uncharacterized protein CCM_08109 [Cordyceps militaris CM01]EGX89856.1 hypothetical protein CCM_08109 [Cordyceps militaris CM01]